MLNRRLRFGVNLDKVLRRILLELSNCFGLPQTVAVGMPKLNRITTWKERVCKEI